MTELNRVDRPGDEAYEIYICGLGIQSVWHLTRETEAAFRRSKEILYLPAGYGVDEYLAQMAPRTTNLHRIAYREGVSRLRAYDAMTAAVLDAAIDHPPVSFAVYGHPLVYAYPPQQILAAAPFLNLRVRVLPAISSLDTMLVDLNLDPAMQGMQMYEATELLVRRRPLQPDVPCLIWQVGAVETSLYSEHKSAPGRFTRIRSYLLQYYPPDHEVVAVYSSTHPLVQSRMDRFALGDIEHRADELHQGLTLYLPPVEMRLIADEELMEILDSADHLASIVTRSRQ